MNDLESWLAEVRSVRLPKVFNPYRDVCNIYDDAHAPEARFSILRGIMERAVECGVDSIWIGRDLGYRGGRRTGLALTDEIHFGAHLSRWNVSCPRPFIKGHAVAERTASVIWSELEGFQGKVLLWNVFPFHPHDQDDPMSNRAHTASERVVGEMLLSRLIKIVRPRSLVAVGQNARDSAIRCSEEIRVHTVRHPSYGGQRDFIDGIRAIHLKV